jgi:hypothetical protein
MAKTTGKVIGEVRELDELRRVFRRRVEDLKITRIGIDEIAGLAAGHSAKILANEPLRGVGFMSLWVLLAALGLKLLVAVDEQATAAMQPRYSEFKRKRRWDESEPAPTAAQDSISTPTAA